jgi:hypothetical protein
MKKIICFVVCCIAVLTVTSCSNKSIVGADGKEYTSYQEACRAGDFEVAHKFLDILHDEYLEEFSDADYYRRFSEKDVKEKYEAALKYIFKQEMMYLASDGSKQASDKILYLLTEIPEEGSPQPDGSKGMGVSEIYASGKDHIAYTKYVTNYNVLCDQILDLAISQDDQYLAKKVLQMYKQTITNHEDGSTSSTRRSWVDKENAIAKSKEAGIDIE